VGERFFDHRDFARLPCLADCGFAALARIEAPPTETPAASGEVEPAFVRKIEALAATIFAWRGRATAHAIGAVVASAGVRACAVFAGAADQEARCRALLFADHLASLRMSRSPIVTALAPDPALLPDRVVIPHLVGVRDGFGIGDAVVWEWAPPAVLTQWSGGRAFDPAPWRERTEHLLGLRRAIRGGDPLAAHHPELLRRLTGRYLSFKFVAQHEALVLAAIHDLERTAAAKIGDARQ